MNHQELLEFKQQVHQACMALVQSQLDTIQKSLDELMEAKSSETKSSAGDKYETGMAMIQNQEELYKRQRADARSRQNKLKSISPTTQLTKADKGALILSSLGNFYICIGLGKVVVEGHEVYVISIESPLGKSLKGKQCGEELTFNGKTSSIENVV
ncbi:hypothetical protein [Nonlabens marinus]|uniref:3-oxoacyl-ACP synthase n=1 Tax=Nonlabens marinus S1-08 TaxID=1454201 RepID=W8VVP4_9FLAO|nr:hypothetical protein [Nonlabens marinus]BAO54052.1 hypothetical protein NMS_0043 [Nonlabens marinus S1-08]